MKKTKRITKTNNSQTKKAAEICGSIHKKEAIKSISENRLEISKNMLRLQTVAYQKIKKSVFMLVSRLYCLVTPTKNPST